MENLKNDLKKGVKIVFKNEKNNKYVLKIYNKDNKIINSYFYYLDIKTIIKHLNIKLSENIFLSEYFLKTLIENKKIIYL